jgi:competence protein ComEC
MTSASAPEATAGRVLAIVIFSWVASGSLLGLVLGSFVVSLVFPLALLALAVSIGGVWGRTRVGQIVFLVCLAVGGGAWRSQEVMAGWREANLAEYEVSGEARVAREPEISERFQKVVLRFEECHEQCPAVLVQGFFSLYERVHYGERVELRCGLQVPKNNGVDFDYRMWLAKEGIGYVCYPSEWRRVDSEGHDLLGSLLVFRRMLETRVYHSIPTPEAALGSGLLFGGDDRLTQDLQEKFSRAGLSHIVAVSGSNVVLVAEYVFVAAIAVGLWRRQALGMALVGVIAFVTMTGASASAVRAGIMGGLTLLAAWSGRVTSGMRALLLAVAIMLLNNPLLFRYDPGFQFSCLATLGILTFLTVRETHSSMLRLSRMREILFMTVAAEVFVLPLVLYQFHFLSFVSLAANILVLPAIPAAMLLTALTAVMGVVMPGADWVTGWMAYGVLHYMVEVVRVLGGWRWAGAEGVNFGVAGVVMWYSVLVILVARYRFKNLKRDGL